ncbi:MAG: hypothetical protein ACFFE8_05075 [Candidatus Heimdallarchaeota archaeon]
METSIIEDEITARAGSLEKPFLVIAILLILNGVFFGFLTVIINLVAITNLETSPGVSIFGLVFGAIMLLITLFYFFGAYGLWKVEHYPWRAVINILIVISIPVTFYLTAGFQDGQLNPTLIALGLTGPVNFIIAGILFKFREKFNNTALSK